MILLLILLTANAGWFAACMHMTYDEFKTFHWMIVFVFIFELLIWEPISFVFQSILCFCIAKKY